MNNGKKLFISDELKEELKCEADMVALFHRLGGSEIKPTNDANQFKAKCIFPDCEAKKNDYPLGINTEKKIFNCFHCGRNGDIFKFIMAAQKCSFFEAKQFLLEWLRGDTRDNIKGQLPKGAPSPTPMNEEKTKDRYKPFGRKLTGLRVEDIPALSEKGIKPSMAEKFGVGYCSQGMMKGRVVVPIYHSEKPGNEDQNILAYAGYSLTKTQKEYGDWKFPDGFEKGRQLYNLNRVIEQTKHAKENLTRHGIIVVESFWNVLKLHQAGITNAVAIMGTAMTQEQERLLLSVTDKVKLWLDTDEPGIKGANNIMRPPDRGGTNGLIFKTHVKIIRPERAFAGNADEWPADKAKPYQFSEDEIKRILGG